MPRQVTTDTASTGAPKATASASATAASGSSQRSALVSTITGLAPLCQAVAR